MASSEAEPLKPNDGAEVSKSGSSESTGKETAKAVSQKASLKRKSNAPQKKKTKKMRVARSARLGYTVHEGEDMLLVISSSQSQYDALRWTKQKKGKKKKKLAKNKKTVVKIKKKRTVCVKPVLVNNPVGAKQKEDAALSVSVVVTDNRWGDGLPEEVLINIFQMIVIQDGAVPFLCSVGRVCRLWQTAASSPVLWRSVTVGFCWIEPRRSQLPKTQKKIKDTISWLAENRFAQLQEFSLCHWIKNVDYAVETVSHFCPHLRSLKLSYCSGLTEKAFQSLSLHSSSLQRIDLQYSEFQVEGLLAYLESNGNQIRQILFTHGLKVDRLLAAITRGFCPDLELLDVNKKLDSKECELPVCIQGLQTACPKLKTFRMMNVRPVHKTMRNGPDSLLGFPLLEELCIATTSYSYTTDKELWEILFGSTKLRVLDLRGCSRITPNGLAALPCSELECLFWGQYFSSSVGLSSSKKGIHLVTQKWSQTLQQLDVGNHLFTEDELELAMSFLTQATDTLRSLNVSGTTITPSSLRSVIGQATALNYLNLSSCRYLPRGMKRIYRGQEDIRQLLDKME